MYDTTYERSEREAMMADEVQADYERDYKMVEQIAVIIIL